MPAKTESGLSDHRIEFVREVENAQGDPVMPTSRDFRTYADSVQTFDWSPDAGYEPQRGIGSVDVDQHFTTAEEHELTVTYDLQNWLVDGAGDPLDAAADGLLRDASGYLPATHTIVQRDNKGQVAADNSVSGLTARESRIYTVIRGAAIDEVTLTGDPGDQAPISVDLSYAAQLGRTFQIDQPNVDTDSYIHVSSSNVADDGLTLHLEDEGGTTIEDVTITGGGDVATTNTFDNIDAAELSERPEGDITLHEDDGSGAGAAGAPGEMLMHFRGFGSYDNVGGGEYGVPGLAAPGGTPGTREGALNSEYERFIGNTFLHDGGDLAMDVNSFEMTVSNNVERTTREDDVAQRMHHGVRDIEATATVIGENETHTKIRDHLQNNGGDLVWNLVGGTITVENARVTENGRPLEAGEAVMDVDSTFTGEGLVVA